MTARPVENARYNIIICHTLRRYRAEILRGQRYLLGTGIYHFIEYIQNQNFKLQTLTFFSFVNFVLERGRTIESIFVNSLAA
jgi:hypothetical protein